MRTGKQICDDIVLHYEAYGCYLNNYTKIPTYRITKDEMICLKTYLCYMLGLKAKDKDYIKQFHGVELQMI